AAPQFVLCAARSTDSAQVTDGAPCTRALRGGRYSIRIDSVMAVEVLNSPGLAEMLDARGFGPVGAHAAKQLADPPPRLDGFRWTQGTCALSVRLWSLHNEFTLDLGSPAKRRSRASAATRGHSAAPGQA